MCLVPNGRKQFDIVHEQRQTRVLQHKQQQLFISMSNYSLQQQTRGTFISKLGCFSRLEVVAALNYLKPQRRHCEASSRHVEITQPNLPTVSRSRNTLKLPILRDFPAKKSSAREICAVPPCHGDVFPCQMHPGCSGRGLCWDWMARAMPSLLCIQCHETEAKDALHSQE